MKKEVHKYIAQIPVRLGSKRIAKKNIRLLNNKPMVAYSIEACKKSKFIGKTIVNSEGEIMKKLCNEYDISFYDRPKELLNDSIVQDQFNYDFLLNNECENMILVNPVSPLVLSQDIDDAISYFEKNNLDSLISVREEKYQSFFKGKPLNFSDQKLLPMTQDLDPVVLCAWTVCIWNKKKFIEKYEKDSYAVFVGNYGLYPFNQIRSLKISEEFEFQMAETILKSNNNEIKKKYYE